MVNKECTMNCGPAFGDTRTLAERMQGCTDCLTIASEGKTIKNKVSNMNFEEFKANVEGWAESRGIYAHSTPQAQLLKTLSELGELADAVIKNDHDALKDAIGDVAVCIVNYARMVDKPTSNIPSFEDGAMASIAEGIGEIAMVVGKLLGGELCGAFETTYILCVLVGICQLADTKEKPVIFSECCELAWNEIKDRTGRMVAGGAFVKD